MFRFTLNHNQTFSKNIDPLHRAIKTRYGIPNVHILIALYSGIMCFFFREGLMMIRRESKYVAQVY